MSLIDNDNVGRAIVGIFFAAVVTLFGALTMRVLLACWPESAVQLDHIGLLVLVALAVVAFVLPWRMKE